MNTLAQKRCIPCKTGARPLAGSQLISLQSELSKGWKVVKHARLEKDYKFKDFGDALAFTNQVGKLAESAQHHPDVLLGWGKVKLTFSTHKINGLSENDFILAARVDGIGQTAVSGH